MLFGHLFDFFFGQPTCGGDVDFLGFSSVHVLGPLLVDSSVKTQIFPVAAASDLIEHGMLRVWSFL